MARTGSFTASPGAVTALKAGEIARLVKGKLIGEADTLISKVSEPESADRNSLAFVAGDAYLEALSTTQAGCILVKPDYESELDLASVCAAVLVADPYLAYAKAAQALYSSPDASGEHAPSSDIADDATIAPGVEIGAQVVVGVRARIDAGVKLGAGVVVGPGAQIGEGTQIDACAVIGNGVHIGKRCNIASGAVIGADGFGFAIDAAKSRWEKIPQIGSVKIGDRVHVGANSCIDRGAIGDTIIEDGVILDNLIQIAHNVRVGKNTAIAGCAAIAGSTRIGKNCLIGGRASIVGHLVICDEVQINANSLVTKSISVAGVYSSAWPALPVGRWRRLLARFRNAE